MQDSRSQHQVSPVADQWICASANRCTQNREWAYQVLRARLAEKRHDEEVEARREGRRSQVKGADRSDKVRTYNFPQVCCSRDGVPS